MNFEIYMDQCFKKRDLTSGTFTNIWRL